MQKLQLVRAARVQNEIVPEKNLIWHEKRFENGKNDGKNDPKRDRKSFSPSQAA